MKNYFLFLLAVVIVCVLPAGAQKEKPAEAAKPVVIKIAHVFNEKFSAHKGTLEFKRACEEKSQGSIKVEIYPNSQLGGERECLEGAKMGTHDIALTGAAGWAILNPDLSVFELPFLYRDLGHQKKVFNDKDLWKNASDMYDKIGLKLLCYYGFGIRSTLANSPIGKLEDFKGLKIRVPEVPIFIKTFEGLGAIPTPISYGETYTALQTKVVSGVESSPESLVSQKFHEVCKYMNLTQHQSPPILVAMNKAKFLKLSSEQQKIVTDAATASSLIEFDLALTGNEAALKTMKETGVQIVDISDAERKRIEEKLQPVIIDLAKSATGVDGMGLYNKIKAIK